MAATLAAIVATNRAAIGKCAQLTGISEGALNHNANRYYAAQKVPGIKNEDEVFCAWVDKNGDVETTGFQVHWLGLNSITTRMARRALNTTARTT